MLGVLSLACTACSGLDDGNELGSSGSSGGDGKVHPAPNGVHLDEAEACDLVQSVIRDKSLKMGCGMTVRACPGFLRVQYSPDCMQYDQGSVLGCVSYFDSIYDCAKLVESNCVLTTYPQSAPAGCP